MTMDDLICLLGSVLLCCSLQSTKLFIVVTGVDYIQPTTTVTFAPCQPKVCNTVRALDDCVLEDDETFNISLTIPRQDPRIRIDRGHGVVTIVDTDSMHS